MRRIFVWLALSLSSVAAAFFLTPLAFADNVPQSLPFNHNWTNIGLITTDDNWSGVPGIIGYRGDALTASTGVNPQTVLVDGTTTPVDVNANRTDPNTFTTGGVAEFHIINPVVALQGSGTARAPFILLHLTTINKTNIVVSYNLRDIDGAADNSVQPVALHFRVGSTGNFTNVPAAFVADASEGPSLAGKVTAVSAMLPASAANQPLLQIRVMTTDAVGSDEWVGIDDIQVTGDDVGTFTNPTGVGTANPSTVAPGDATLLTVAVTPGTNPTSTNIMVSADLNSIGGSSSQQFFDDGTNGDTVAGNNVFSFQATVTTNTPSGAKRLPVTITDGENRTAPPTSISLTVREPQFVVISQVYGGGGNSGATLRNDFIEVFNRGTNSVVITGWSVQYTSSGGTIWQVTPLSGVLAPGGYYLVQQAAGAGGTENLPAPDATGTSAMSNTAGKVALVSNSTALTGFCPSDVVDFVGYGGANCFEGSAPVAQLSNTSAAVRRRGGCTDTDNNGPDFQVRPPTPRNSASPIRDCQAPDLELSIPQIQGEGASTPFPDREVGTTGIVTARKSNGFFIQNPTPDSNPNTSEGLFVFVGGLPAAQVGDAVHVSGVAGEFFDLTQISAFAVDVSVTSSGNLVPAPVMLTTAILNPAGTIDQLERFESMRVHADSLTSIAPSNGFGEVFTVLTGVARPFREIGLEASHPLPPGSPCCIPRFDENPEKLMVDTDGLLGSMPLNVTSGVMLSNVFGPLDFTFDDYKVIPEVAPGVTPNITATPVPQPTADEFTIGSFNLLNFFVSNGNFADRLKKASLAIRNVMHSPDIIGVEEVGDIAALTALATQLNADSVAAGHANPMYEAHLLEGSEDFPGDDIDVGFLLKRSRVEPVELIQRGKGAKFTDPTDGSQDTLFERPPLVLRANVQSPHGSKFPITVIVNHMQSLIDVEDPTRGPRQRLKRQLQAEFTARLAEELQDGNLVLVGDFNAFQFSDGLVDVMGTIAGTPTPSDQVLLASPDLVDPDLEILVNTLTAVQKYSFIFRGNAQTIDHVVVDNEMEAQLSRFAYARNNADFPTSFETDPTRPERISDHDMPVAFFNFPPPAADLSVTKSTTASTVVSGSDFSYSIDVTNDGSDHALSVTLSDDLPANTTFRGITTPAGWTCTTPTVGNTGTLSCTMDSLNSGTSASVTVAVTLACATANGATATNTVTVQSTITDPDSSNNTASATITASNPAPVISGASVDKTTIKPPNHKMVDVTVSYSVSDNCGPVTTTLTVTSNEPVNSTGDGNSEVDWEVVDAHHVRLRAERDGSGNGRIYTITITATDSAGHSSSQSVTVSVPK